LNSDKYNFRIFSILFREKCSDIFFGKEVFDFFWKKVSMLFPEKNFRFFFGKKVSYQINTIPEFFSEKSFNREKRSNFFGKKNGNFLYFDDEFILLKIKILN
jgi:hypothetical protein